MNADGTEVRRLTDDPGEDLDPDWSWASAASDQDSPLNSSGHSDWVRIEGRTPSSGAWPETRERDGDYPCLSGFGMSASVTLASNSWYEPMNARRVRAVAPKPSNSATVSPSGS